jgi:nuclear pore complex protein Nup205
MSKHFVAFLITSPEMIRVARASKQVFNFPQSELPIPIANHRTIGKLARDGQEYEINDQFQQGTFQLADELNLDEIDAAQIFLDAQDDADATGRSVLSCSLIRFHQRRKTLLDCLRLILQFNGDADELLEQEVKDFLGHIIKDVVRPQNATSSQNFVQKCLSAMGDIKRLLQKISDKISSASVLGQPSQPEQLEIMEYQRSSLVKQHEILGTIILYLVKANHVIQGDFEVLLGALKKADKYDNLLGRYSVADSL